MITRRTLLKGAAAAVGGTIGALLYPYPVAKAAEDRSPWRGIETYLQPWIATERELLDRYAWTQHNTGFSIVPEAM